MCYGVNYDCVVSCVNSDLNQTLLSSGIVKGNFGNSCRIVCQEGIKYSEHIQQGFIPTAPTSVQIIMIAVISLGLTYIFWRLLK